MHKRIKALVITGVITVNTASPVLEVFANELDSEINTNEIQTTESKEINNEVTENSENSNSTYTLNKLEITQSQSDWSYSTANNIGIDLGFSNVNNSEKIVEIELPEGMVFERYPVIGATSSTVESIATDEEKNIIESVEAKPSQDPTTGLYNGKLVYKIKQGVASCRINIKVSVDKYKYYQPKTINDAIKVTVKEDNLVVGTKSVNVNATNHATIGAKNNSLKSSSTGRTETIEPGGIGTTYSYFRNTTSTNSSGSAIKDFTFIKNAELTMYYPSGAKLSSVNNLPDDATYENFENENKVVITMPNPTIFSKSINLTYEVPTSQGFGEIIAPNKNTMEVTYYDDIKETFTATVQESVEVVDPSLLGDIIEMSMIDGYYHDYDGNSLSIGGFMYLQNQTVKEYTDQVFEYQFENWNTRKVLIPDSMTNITNIKYRKTGDDTEYNINADQLGTYLKQKRLIDGDALGLAEGEYFTWVSFEVTSIPTGFDDSKNGRYNDLAISLGELPYNVNQGKTTVKIYKKGNKGSVKTLTQPIKRVNKPESISMLTGESKLTDTSGNDVKNSLTQEALTASVLFDANKGFNRIYNASNYMENPEIIIRMPEGFYLSTGTIKLTQAGQEKTFSIKEHKTTDNSTIYTLQTEDVKIGGFDPRTLEISPGINVKFEFVTDSNVEGTYDLSDMIFIGKKGSNIEQYYNNSNFLYDKDDVFELLQEEERVLGRAKTNSFQIIQSKELEVMTHVREHNSDIDSPPYNTEDESTAMQVSKGSLIDYIVKIKNNSEHPAEDFDVYIPIPKKGLKIGDEVQTGEFQWDMVLEGDVEVKVGNKNNTSSSQPNDLFVVEYGKAQGDQTSYTTTYNAAEHDIIRVRAKREIDPDIFGEIKFTFKVSENVSQIDGLKPNVFNAYYRRKYNNATTDIRLKGNSIGLKLDIKQIRGFAFIDKDRDGIYKIGTDEILSDVDVELWDKTNDTKLETTTTDNTGMYIFDGLANEEYEVKIVNNDANLDVSDLNAKRFTKQTTLTEDTYKVDSDFISTDNINGYISVSIPTTSDIYDINDYVNVGFVEPVTISITTEGNGSIEGNDSYTYKAWPFEAISEPTNIVAKDGYEFVNYTDTLTGNVFDFSKEITSDTTIKANFRKKIYKLTLDPNEGDGNIIEKNIVFDELLKQELDSLTEPTRQGYKFIGWTKDKSTNVLISDTDKMPSSELTLYAVWDKAPEINIDNTEVTIKAGNPFNLMDGVTVSDQEDKDLDIKDIKVSGDTVDENTLPGVYTITYTVEDSVGNITTVSRKVTVLSNNAPEVTGGGNKTLKPSQIDTFDPTSDLTIIDDHDTKDDIKATITITDQNSGQVVDKISKPQAGTENIYNISIVFTDTDNNSTTVERVITVINNKPTISGLEDIEIRKGKTFDVMDKVTATDVEDGEIESSEIQASITDLSTLEVGEYTITYTVTDKDGNKTTKTRKVTVVSNNAPEVTGTLDITLNPSHLVEFNKDVTAGLTISDDHDTDKLVIETTITKDSQEVTELTKPAVGTENNYEITIKVTDSDGNTTTVERNVTVTNYAPMIDGLTDIMIRKGQTFDLMDKVMATDLEDKDITSKITMSLISRSNIDVSKLEVGEYTIEYTVTDVDGNTTTELRKLIVVTNDKPTISGGGDLILKPSQVDSFDPIADLIITDDHDIKDDLVINTIIKDESGQNVTELTKPAVGTENKYEISIEVIDKDGNITTINRVVTVTNYAPIINGLTDITIKRGQVFDIQFGVTASDVEDGDITNVILFPNVDVSKLEVGEHTIGYTVTDSDGNTTTILRKVIVEKNEAPTIIVEDKTIEVGSTFDPLAGVVAMDTEEGDITDKIKVIENTVDTSKEGEYVVVYEATDSYGETTTKSIVVKVVNKNIIESTKPNTKPINPDTTIKDEVNTNNNHNNPQTGDTSLMRHIGMLFSSVGLLIANRRKKKK